MLGLVSTRRTRTSRIDTIAKRRCRADRHAPNRARPFGARRVAPHRRCRTLRPCRPCPGCRWSISPMAAGRGPSCAIRSASPRRWPRSPRTCARCGRCRRRRRARCCWCRPTGRRRCRRCRATRPRACSTTTSASRPRPTRCGGRRRARRRWPSGCELLADADIASAADAERGFDHATFVPLSLTYPDAEMPTVQLSLQAGLDPAAHLAIGAALAPLRDEGVFILGSGLSFHDLRALRDARPKPSSVAFDAWLEATVTAAPAVRDAGLRAWATAPAARDAHPREEHLVPLHVVAGAAGADVGRIAHRGTLRGARVSAVHFGDGAGVTA
ncbi:MAG: class III extradiol ring-cleavage dioxygenase [Kofleriaceae bacterium]